MNKKHLNHISNLTDKQKTFCEEYIVDMNATQAAIRAGYSKKTARFQAYQIKKKNHVRRYIKELQNNRSKRVQITADDVLNDIIEVKDRCLRAVPVLEYNKETKQKEPTGEYKFEYNGALRALELLGKHLGLWKDRIEHSGSLEVKKKLEEYFK